MKKTLKEIFLLNEEGVFGDYFAGERRKLPTPANPEIDTDKERELFFALQNHLDFKDKPLGLEPGKTIKKFLKHGDYSDFFIKPEVDVVYRGMRLNPDAFKKFIRTIDGSQYDSMIKIPHGTVNLNGLKYSFQPKNHNGGTSWTKDKSVAEDFALGLGVERKPMFAIILCAEVAKNPNNLFDLRKWYKEIDGALSHEAEVIGLGKVFVHKIIWQKTGEHWEND